MNHHHYEACLFIYLPLGLVILTQLIICSYVLYYINEDYLSKISIVLKEILT